MGQPLDEVTVVEEVEATVIDPPAGRPALYPAPMASGDDRGDGALGAGALGLDSTFVETRGPEFVQSLERGLSVIRAFGPDRARLTLTEVARETGLTRAAARRFLLTLVELGYVRNDGREFSLRPRVLDLGYAYLSGLSLPEVAQPHMEDLVRSVHESSSISVLDGSEIVYVVRVPTKRIMTVAISVGTRFPAYCTSMGRVLLAELDDEGLDGYLSRVQLQSRTEATVTDEGAFRKLLHEIAEQGFAIVDQELEDGLISLAVPIRDATGNVVAALNVSANALRVDVAALERDFLPPLLGTGRHIEDGLRAAAPAGIARGIR